MQRRSVGLISAGNRDIVPLVALRSFREAKVGRIGIPSRRYCDSKYLEILEMSGIGTKIL